MTFTTITRDQWQSILLTKDELAEFLDRSPHTLKGKMSKSPDALPPMVVVGARIRLFPRALIFAWQAEDVISTPVKIDISGLPAQMKRSDLASLLRLSESSIPSMQSRNPRSLPPGGRFGLWNTATVFGWLADHVRGVPRDKMEIVTVVAAMPPPLSTADLLLRGAFT